MGDVHQSGTVGVTEDSGEALGRATNKKMLELDVSVTDIQLKSQC